MLDLAGFHTADADLALSQVNVVLEIELDKIIEDPDQPRQEFDSEYLNALAADIAIRGVQTPINVQPAVGGIYKIIHGACRYRASKIAGRSTIRLIVEPDLQNYDDYSQVAENTKRADLHAIDIARFIKKRKQQGESNKEIAERLGERPEYIVHHMAILEAPQPILDAFKEGRIRGAQTVWSMTKLYEKDPLAVDLLLDTAGEITRKMIRDASNVANADSGAILDLNEGETAQDNPTTIVPKNDSDAVSQADPVSLSSEDSKATTDTSPKNMVANKQQRSSKVSAQAHTSPTSKFQRPVVYGVYERRPVEVCIFRKPTDHGLVWIKWEDEKGPEEEVLADKVSLSRVEGE